MADVIAIPLGRDAKLYYGVPNSGQTCAEQAASLESATIEVQGVRDLTITIEKDDVDVTRRRSHGWEDSRESVKRLSVSFDMPATFDADVEQDAIRTIRKTFGNGTYDGAQAVSGICFYMLSSKADNVLDEPGPQAVAGNGICADFLVTKFERAEPLGDQQIYSVEAKMTQVHNRIPAWYPDT